MEKAISEGEGRGLRNRTPLLPHRKPLLEKGFALEMFDSPAFLHVCIKDSCTEQGICLHWPLFRRELSAEKLLAAHASTGLLTCLFSAGERNVSHECRALVCYF